jgi:hypothetical protein
MQQLINSLDQLNLERIQAYPDGLVHHHHHHERKMSIDEVSRGTSKPMPYYINCNPLDPETPPQITPSVPNPLKGVERHRNVHPSVADSLLLQQQHHERNVSTGKVTRKPVPPRFDYKPQASTTTSETILSPPIPLRGAARVARRPTRPVGHEGSPPLVAAARPTGGDLDRV